VCVRDVRCNVAVNNIGTTSDTCSMHECSLPVCADTARLCTRHSRACLPGRLLVCSSAVSSHCIAGTVSQPCANVLPGCTGCDCGLRCDKHRHVCSCKDVGQRAAAPGQSQHRHCSCRQQGGSRRKARRRLCGAPPPPPSSSPSTHTHTLTHSLTHSHTHTHFHTQTRSSRVLIVPLLLHLSLLCVCLLTPFLLFHQREWSLYHASVADAPRPCPRYAHRKLKRTLKTMGFCSWRHRQRPQRTSTRSSWPLVSPRLLPHSPSGLSSSAPAHPPINNHTILLGCVRLPPYLH
jgi:hypothetical protein